MAVYRKNFITQLQSLKRRIGEERDREAAKEYLKVETFVKGCCYTKYYNAKRLVAYILSGHTVEQCSVYLETTVSNVREQLRSLSDKLFTIYGEDIFDLFKQFHLNAKEIHKRVYIAERCEKVSSDYIMLDMLSLLMQGKNEKEGGKKYSIYDCEDELKFILRHSIPSIKAELAGLDSLKLNYLLGVLDNKQGTLDERYYFVTLLETKEEEDKDVFNNL